MDFSSTTPCGSGGFSVCEAGYTFKIGTRLNNKSSGPTRASTQGGKSDRVAMKQMALQLQREGKDSLFKRQAENILTQIRKENGLTNQRAFEKEMQMTARDVYDGGSKASFYDVDRGNVYAQVNSLFGDNCVRINPKAALLEQETADLFLDMGMLAQNPDKIGLFFMDRHLAGLKRVSSNVYVVFNAIANTYVLSCMEILTQTHSEIDGFPRSAEIVPFFEPDEGQTFQSVLSELGRNQNVMYYLFLTDWNIQHCPDTAIQEYKREQDQLMPEQIREWMYFQRSIELAMRTQQNSQTCNVPGNLGCQTLTFMFFLPFLPEDQGPGTRATSSTDNYCGKYGLHVLELWRTMREHTPLVLRALEFFSARVITASHAHKMDPNKRRAMVMDAAVQIIYNLNELREDRPCNIM